MALESFAEKVREATSVQEDGAEPPDGGKIYFKQSQARRCSAGNPPAENQEGKLNDGRHSHHHQ